ncbi:NAD(P)H-binding protein [Solwaraspora sp. WMMD792]|uniref:NAD(P)-dependent oxidoreductase n=1 Tax=Solwaraspora sp. WMMD792 TaxID=3016099 RepID=UPI002415E7A2|nr:NAD(P)H-binding protein [Solwaraspora sp. WMMD792]MDG4770116.1 NAD(P)H-binding protein [Solwaraspora sp. WMMD792]
MRIVVVGTGFAGAALVREFAARGHDVVAVSRSAAGTWPAGVSSVPGTVYDPSFASRMASDADVLAVALPALSAEGGIVASVRALLPAISRRVRLGIVGGSAVLPLRAGGPRLGDTDSFPAALRPRVTAHQQALDTLAASPDEIDWFVLVPAAEFGPHAPGTRRGTYRTSRTALVSDANGRSAIGVEDYASAFADEIEAPTTHRSWLTVGY